MRRGGERYLHELAVHLHRGGHDVRIVTTSAAPGRDRVLDVPVVRLPVRRWHPTRHGDLATEVAFGWQSLAHLGAGRLDVWHAMGTADGAAAALVGRVRPRLTTVFTDHGIPAARSRHRRTDRRYHQAIVDHVDTYVCVSETAGDWLRRDHGREPTVIPPGVDLSAWHVGTARHPRPALLYTGSLTEPRKHVDALLAAAARLRPSHPDLEVWLHGEGDAGALLAGAPAPDVVTRCGVAGREDLAEAYGRAWVTVLPSEAEAFGMTVVESLACGTPVVVLADSGGPAGIVADHPAAAVLAPSVDVDALAVAIDRALDLAGRADTREAARAVAEPYAWPRVVAAIERVYAGTDGGWS